MPVGIHVCVCLSGGQKSTLDVVPQLTTTLFLMQLLALLSSSRLSYAGLAKVPGIHLSLPPQPWFFKCTPLKLLLCGGSLARCQGGCIGRQTLSRWSCLSTPTLPLLPKRSWLGVPAIDLHLQVLWWRIWPNPAIVYLRLQVKSDLERALTARSCDMIPELPLPRVTD